MSILLFTYKRPFPERGREHIIMSLECSVPYNSLQGATVDQMIHKSKLMHYHAPCNKMICRASEQCAMDGAAINYPGVLCVFYFLGLWTTRRS